MPPKSWILVATGGGQFQRADGHRKSTAGWFPVATGPSSEQESLEPEDLARTARVWPDPRHPQDVRCGSKIPLDLKTERLLT